MKRSIYLHTIGLAIISTTNSIAFAQPMNETTQRMGETTRSMNDTTQPLIELPSMQSDSTFSHAMEEMQETTKEVEAINRAMDSAMTKMMPTSRTLSADEINKLSKRNTEEKGHDNFATSQILEKNALYHGQFETHGAIGLQFR